MTDVTMLLVLLFSMTITEPKPPERLPISSVCAEIVEETPTIYTMTEDELSALTLKQKAKLLKMNKQTFKTFVKLVNREAGPKMQDKILVAAVVWNRKYCSQFPNTVRKVMFQPGQFTLRGDTKTEIHGNVNDKEAQLAILLAYRQVHTNKVPHNVLYFNSISYRTKSPKRFTKYKHHNNYFIKDSKCKCRWCTV